MDRHTAEHALTPSRDPGPARPLRRFLRTSSLLGVSGAALALLFADRVPIDPLVPADVASPFELVAVRANALRFHLALIGAGALVVLLLTRHARWALAAAAVALWAALPILRAHDVERPPAADAAPLRLLSINLAIEHARSADVRTAIARFEPDVIVFQEYTATRAAALGDALQATYPTRFERPRNDSFGLAVFARVPVHALTPFTLGDSKTPQVRLEIPWGTSQLVLYGIHLVPIHAGLYDRHRREFADLAQRVARETGPTVLVGDFNFVTHGALSRHLEGMGYLDTHALAGSGRGPSWPVQLMQLGIPGIRIDHVYVGPGLTAREAWVGEANGSDHLPIGAVVVPAAPTHP